MRASNRLLENDFILTHNIDRQSDIIDSCGNGDSDFTHVIMNPQHKEINSSVTREIGRARDRHGSGGGGRGR